MEKFTSSLRVLPLVVLFLLYLEVGVCKHVENIDDGRVLEELRKLASFNDLELPAVQRIVFTRNDVGARDYIRSLMTGVGLKVREDALGNIFGRWAGQNSRSAIGTGSHFDAIPYSGMYDGTFGIIGALEAIRSLKRVGFSPEKSIDVIAFTSEEPTRFGIGCLGSRGLSGVMGPKDFLSLTDDEGVSFDEARTEAGYTTPLSDFALSSNSYAGFVELHIEQAPSLEQDQLDIGVVTSIAAPASINVEFKGPGGHAGGLLMPFRADAGLAGAELALEVEKSTLSTGHIDTVGTTGTFKLSPGAINSVPRVARLGIDVRDIETDRRDGVLDDIIEAARKIAKRRKVEHEVTVLNADDPAHCSDIVIEAVEEAAKRLGLSSKRMVSRAYHDSLFMAYNFPTGMIFVPCKDGISHRPDEYITPEAIQNGVAVLANTLSQLAGSVVSPSVQDEL